MIFSNDHVQQKFPLDESGDFEVPSERPRKRTISSLLQWAVLLFLFISFFLFLSYYVYKRTVIRFLKNAATITRLDL